MFCRQQLVYSGLLSLVFDGKVLKNNNLRRGID